MTRKNYRKSISQADQVAASGKRREPVNLFITVLIIRSESSHKQPSWQQSLKRAKPKEETDRVIVGMQIVRGHFSALSPSTFHNLGSLGFKKKSLLKEASKKSIPVFLPYQVSKCQAIYSSGQKLVHLLMQTYFRIIHVSRTARNKLMITSTNHLEHVLNNTARRFLPFL